MLSEMKGEDGKWSGGREGGGERRRAGENGGGREREGERLKGESSARRWRGRLFQSAERHWLGSLNDDTGQTRGLGVSATELAVQHFPTQVVVSRCLVPCLVVGGVSVHWSLGIRHWTLGTGHWATGQLDNWTLDTEYWALGIGHRALDNCRGMLRRCV